MRKERGQAGLIQGGENTVVLRCWATGDTTGAEDDLQAATALAWRMVTHWGMGRQVGPVFADVCEVERLGLLSHAQAAPVPPRRLASAARYISGEAMATLIDSEIQSILHEGRATASTVLSEHYDQLTKLAQLLIEHEQLNRTQFEAVLQQM